MRLSTFTIRTVHHTVNCLHNHHLDTRFNMCSSLYLNSYWSVGEIKTFTHFRTKLKAIRNQRSLLQGYNYDVELLPLPPGDTAVHVFHDPLANGGGGINRRCSVEESSAISPVLEKMEEHVYTTKHLVSYRTIHHEATLQLAVFLLLPQEEVQCFCSPL